MKSSPVIYLVDDDPMVRKTLSHLLSTVGMRVEAFASAADFLGEADTNTHGCLLLDLFMPSMSGLDLLQTLREKEISIPTIFVTAHGDVSTAVRAMKAGAFDYLEKPFGHQELLDRVNQAIAMDERQRHQVRLVRDWRHRLSTLTDRENTVLSMVVAGRMSKDIASELGVSLKTIERHRARIMDKLQVGSVAELVRVVIATDPDAALAA